MLRFSGFPELFHAISTRGNGVSSGPYHARNLGFHVGDEAENVRENRRILARECGFKVENLVCAQQVHGSEIQIVTRAQRGRGALDWAGALPACDALVTAETGVPLLILVADCAPILLFDPENRVLAVVHAGWRGAVAGIVAKTVATMNAHFGSNPREIRAGIGPCLCAENLEIGPEVAAQIGEKSALAPRGEKFLLDLRELLAHDLENAGIERENLEISPFCPKNRGDLFFSHRGQNGIAGRFGLVAWL